MSMTEEDHRRLMQRMLSMPGAELGRSPIYELKDGQQRHMANEKLQSISADKQTAAVRGVRTDNKRKGAHQPKKARNQKRK